MKSKEPLPLTFSTRELRIADFGGALAVWGMVEGVEVAEGDSEGEIKEYLLRNPGLSRVAVSGDTIVGAVLCGHDGRRGLIYHLAVAPAFQGKGIGRQLLQECVTGLCSASLTRAIILVSGENAAGHSFWLRNGWEDIPGAIPMARDL